MDSYRMYTRRGSLALPAETKTMVSKQKRPHSHSERVYFFGLVTLGREKEAHHLDRAVQEGEAAQ